jgi:proteasome lid subunit RPN8/RPN11
MLDAIVKHAREGAPNEACGLIAAADGRAVKFYPIRNADASPVHYNMDSQEQLQAMLDMDDNNWELGGIYHSHTHTRAQPSATDVELAAYPEALYIIVSLAYEPDVEVRGFHIKGGVIEDAALEIED